MEPEPEPGPQERLIQRSQQYVASGAGGMMIERLRARRDHQEATLAMLRGAGADEEELQVIKADVEVLQRQVAEYEEQQEAMARAREAARHAQEQAQRQRAEQVRAAEAARLAREAAAAEAAEQVLSISLSPSLPLFLCVRACLPASLPPRQPASLPPSLPPSLLSVFSDARGEQVRLAADASARAEAEAASQAAAAAAEAAAATGAEAAQARQREADAALAQQVEAELLAAEAGEVAMQHAADALTESTVRTEWRVEVLDAKVNKEGEDGWIFSAPEYTTYEIQVTRPEGAATLITKRYSDFTELKTKLAATEEAKQAEIAKLDFATWTWTKGGSMHEETIRDRKIKLGSWLNAVLYLCPGAKDVVEFIDGEAGLLASVNDGTSQPE